jgi:hypothetical protein
MAAIYKGQHNHRRHANIHSSIGIRNQTPVFERTKTVHALDRAATLIDHLSTLTVLIRESKLLIWCSRILLQKLIVAQLVRTFSAIMELEVRYLTHQSEKSEPYVILLNTCPSQGTIVFAVVLLEDRPLLVATNCCSVYLQVLYHRILRTRHILLTPLRNRKMFVWSFNCNICYVHLELQCCGSARNGSAKVITLLWGLCGSYRLAI